MAYGIGIDRPTDEALGAHATTIDALVGPDRDGIGDESALFAVNEIDDKGNFVGQPIY